MILEICSGFPRDHSPSYEVSAFHHFLDSALIPASHIFQIFFAPSFLDSIFFPVRCTNIWSADAPPQPEYKREFGPLSPPLSFKPDFSPNPFSPIMKSPKLTFLVRHRHPPSHVCCWGVVSRCRQFPTPSSFPQLDDSVHTLFGNVDPFSHILCPFTLMYHS